MIFTPEEIQQLFKIVDYRLARIVADVLGREFLTPQDEALLKQFGFDFREGLKQVPPYYQAFIFGRLAGVLSPNQLFTLDYKDIREYVDKDQYPKLTRREKAEYAAAATRTYGYIKGMGERVKKTLGNSVSEEEIKNAVEERRIEELSVIKREHERGVLERRSVQAIVSSIGNQLKDWNRDWGRIVETEMENIFLLGVAQVIMEDHGPDALVYKDVFPGACFPVKDTEFLTKEGFKFLDDVKEDDEVLTFNLETGFAEYSKINSVIRYQYTGDMHLYKNNHMDLLSTPNHKHLIGKRIKWQKEIKYENVLIASENMRNLNRRDIMYLTSNWKGYSKEEISICGKTFKTSIFARFMGWYMSEGCISFRRKFSSGRTNSTIICICQKKEKYFTEIEECLKGMFPEKIVYTKSGDFKVILDQSYDDLSKWFISLGDRSYNKKIPQEVLTLDKIYLQEFLLSFAKGDGYGSRLEKGDLDAEGTLHLCTSSKKMADDLCELILKSGYNPSLTVKDFIGRETFKKDGARIETKHLIYRIRVCKWKSVLNVNRFFSVIKDWKGEVGCIEAEKNHTLFIRRNGRMIWTGNCTHCRRLYTTAGSGSEPRVFKLSSLIANGDNIGRKAKDWLPTVSPCHPYCRCLLRYLPKGYVWDEETRSFRPPKDYKPRVERKSKVYITVGNKKFTV